MMDSKLLAGKVAVITGGTRGIGLATAKAFASAGCTVAISGRDRDALQSASTSLRQSTATVIADICDQRKRTSVDTFFGKIRKECGRIDVLFNNAGRSHPSLPVDQLSLDDWEEVIETNLTGMFLCTRAALPMMGRGSTIINNLSITAKTTFPGLSAYAASKHGALGLTNTLRSELHERGIRVIALLAGATDTEIWNQFWPDAPREKMISPSTVAAAIVHAVLLPEDAVVEELVLGPVCGAL